MILYITDRGQCYWSEIFRISNSAFQGYPIMIEEDCVIVTRSVFDYSGVK